jgi:hypothetical protein
MMALVGGAGASTASGLMLKSAPMSITATAFASMMALSVRRM